MSECNKINKIFHCVGELKNIIKWHNILILYTWADIYWKFVFENVKMMVYNSIVAAHCPIITIYEYPIVKYTLNHLVVFHAQSYIF